MAKAKKTKTVFTNKDGKEYEYYRISKTIGYTTNDKGVTIPVRKFFTGKTIKECQSKYDEFMEKKNQGLETKKQYFGILLENWINDFFINNDNLSFNTRDSYISVWRNYLKDSSLVLLELDHVSAQTIQHFYNDLDCQPSVIRKINNLLGRFYKYLEQQGLARNFTGALSIPKENKKAEMETEIVTFTEDEIKLIFNGFDKADKRFRIRFLIVLAYYTGCRISELRALKYSDIDLNNKSITISRQIIDYKELSTKSDETKRSQRTAPLKSKNSYRTIPLHDNVIEEFKIHKQWHNKEMMKNGYRTEFIFTTSSGSLYDRPNLKHALVRYYKRIGMPVYKKGKNDTDIYKTFHVFRHTFATNLVKSGIPIQVASSLLGHANISITAKYYVGVDVDQKRQAIAQLSNVF